MATTPGGGGGGGGVGAAGGVAWVAGRRRAFALPKTNATSLNSTTHLEAHLVGSAPPACTVE